MGVARYRIRTLRRTFRVQGTTLKALHQQIVKQVQRSAKTIPQQIVICRIPKDTGMGRFILGVIPAQERLLELKEVDTF